MLLLLLGGGDAVSGTVGEMEEEASPEEDNISSRTRVPTSDSSTTLFENGFEFACVCFVGLRRVHQVMR